VNYKDRIDIRTFKTFFINVESHLNKRLEVEDRLIRRGFESISRIQAIENTVDGQIGLIETHATLLATLKVPFLLLEDDIEILNYNFEVSIPNDCDVLYLGNSVWGEWDKKAKIGVDFNSIDGSPNILRVRNMLSCHAMLFLCQEYVDFCAKGLKEEITAGLPSISRIDQFYARTQHHYNIFALDFPIFFQKHNSKSMTRNEKWTKNKLTDFNFKLFFFYNFLTRFTNFIWKLK
jgi:hypothetical protein